VNQLLVVTRGAGQLPGSPADGPGKLQGRCAATAIATALGSSALLVHAPAATWRVLQMQKQQAQMARRALT
jgi:hypothetical protein